MTTSGNRNYSIRRVVLCFAFVSAMGCEMAKSGEFPTPHAALKALEDAYRRKDIDAAVAAKDFSAEALEMLSDLQDTEKSGADSLSSDPEILKSSAELLELSFRKEIQDNGFPDFEGLKCSAKVVAKLSANLVVLREVCIYPDGGSSTQDMYASKIGSGWKIAGLIDR